MITPPEVNLVLHAVPRDDFPRTPDRLPRHDNPRQVPKKLVTKRRKKNAAAAASRHANQQRKQTG